jgi:hypothetical protein
VKLSISSKNLLYSPMPGADSSLGKLSTISVLDFPKRRRPDSTWQVEQVNSRPAPHLGQSATLMIDLGRGQ